MYILNINILQAGDIILMRSNSDISRRVREQSNSQFSHAMLSVDHSSLIESDGNGVQANNVQRCLFENEDDVVVLRLKNNTLQVIEKVEEFARRMIGTEYSVKEAFRAAKNSTTDHDALEPNRQFCTRFISEAYDSAGVQLTVNKSYCTPEDILSSNQLEKVFNVLNKASDAQIEFANSESQLKTQEEIHNSILSKARELSGKDIQTFEQFAKLILDEPKYDHELTNFVRESGYLFFIENDMKKNPWHYDAQAFIAHYGLSFDVYNQILEGNQKLSERFKHQKREFEILCKKHNRLYFQLELTLYAKLVELMANQVDELIKVQEKLKHFEYIINSLQKGSSNSSIELLNNITDDEIQALCEFRLNSELQVLQKIAQDTLMDLQMVASGGHLLDVARIQEILVKIDNILS